MVVDDGDVGEGSWSDDDCVLLGLKDFEGEGQGLGVDM